MSQDPLVGTVLGGARLMQRVSKGLMAHVYQGHYERLGVPVAVKVLSPKATSQGVNRERFVREGRALAQLSHPNIIKIYNVGHENGRFFIIMDWIQDGMNLRQLAQTRPLTPAQSLKVVQRLCDALEYIHGRELVHRDIKPANVCLRRGGHPVLMDFSLIKDQKSDVQLTAPGTIMGTVNFMPPEQAQPGGAFGNVGPRSDVYSIGGTAYWLLTGQPPFKGRTPMETIIKLMREQPQPPSVHNPSLPKVVDEVVLAALSKKSADRPESARALAERIEFLFQNHRAELDGAQRPALADDNNSGRQPQQPAAPQPAAQQPAAQQQAAWGSSSSQNATAATATAPPPQPAAPQAPPQPVAPPQPAAMQAPPQPAAPQAPPQPANPMAAPANPMAQAPPQPANPMAPPPNPMAPPGQPAAPPASNPMAPAPAAPADDPVGDADAGGGGGVFVPSMSTEGAAAGMLQLPEELREEGGGKSSGGAGGKILTVVLVLIIVGALAVAGLLVSGVWQPF